MLLETNRNFGKSAESDTDTERTSCHYNDRPRFSIFSIVGIIIGTIVCTIIRAAVKRGNLADLNSLLNKPEFPKAAAYEPTWVLQNQMGPNALWLTEWLCEVLPLEPRMRVLDQGCERAMSSVFLAREFGCWSFETASSRLRRSEDTRVWTPDRPGYSSSRGVTGAGEGRG